MGVTQKTSSPPGLPGMVPCGGSEAWAWPAVVCTWWPGLSGGYIAELALLLPVSTVLLAIEECHLVDTRMGWGREALPGLEGRTCVERKVDFEQPGTMAGVLVCLSWPVPSPGGQ